MRILNGLGALSLAFASLVGSQASAAICLNQTNVTIQNGNTVTLNFDVADFDGSANASLDWAIDSGQIPLDALSGAQTFLSIVPVYDDNSVEDYTTGNYYIAGWPYAHLGALSGSMSLNSSRDVIAVKLIAQGNNTSQSFSLSNLTVTSTACTVGANTAPVADAGADQAVSSAATVTLNGTGSTDADNDPLTYTWSQTSGTTVTLSSTTAGQPTFTAPTLAAGAANETLVFSLIVNDGTVSSTADTIQVTVQAPSTPNTPPTPSTTGVCFSTQDVTATSRLISFDTGVTSSAGSATYTLTWTATSNGTMSDWMTIGANMASLQVDLTSANQTETITVTQTGTVDRFGFTNGSNMQGVGFTGLTITSPSCTGGSSGGSSGTTTSTPATASATIIQSDVARVTRGAINANNKMVSQGLARFLADRESGIPLAESVSSSGMSSFKIEPNVTPINNGQGLSLNGIFGGTTTDGTYRRVTFGEFDIQHEPGSGTTLNFHTRLAWERAAGDDAMLAYFVGAELNNSTISSTYTGTQSRYGVTAGMYGVKALGQNLYAAGYGSYGMARNNLSITDGTTDISGSYNTRSFGLGGQISGSIDKASYKIRPTVSLNFMQTWVGDVSLSSTAAGATSTITASVGNTNTLELLATPEFLFPVEVGNSSDAKVTASVAPRLICERNYGAGAVTKNCGAGAQLGLNQVSTDGSTNLNASVRLDRIGGVNRRGLNLQAELRF